MNKIISIALILSTLLVGCSRYQATDTSIVYNILTENVGVRLHVVNPQLCYQHSGIVDCIGMVEDTRLEGEWYSRSLQESVTFTRTNKDQLIIVFSNGSIGYVSPYGPEHKYIILFDNDTSVLAQVEIYDGIYMHLTIGNNKPIPLVKVMVGNPA